MSPETSARRRARQLGLIGGMIVIALAAVSMAAPEMMSTVGAAVGIFLLAFARAGLILLLRRRILPIRGIRIGDGW